MDFGLGIHGEPGDQFSAVDERQGFGDRLVERCSHERPQEPAVGSPYCQRARRNQVRGAVCAVGRRRGAAGAAGLELVEPEVGELVTSLDMAGCSLLDHLAGRGTGALLGGTGRHPSLPPGYRSRTPEVRHRAPDDDRGRFASGSGRGRARNPLPQRRRPRSRCVPLSETAETHKDYLGRSTRSPATVTTGIGMSRGAKAAAEAAAQTEARRADGAGSGRRRLQRQGRRHQRGPLGYADRRRRPGARRHRAGYAERHARRRSAQPLIDPKAPQQASPATRPMLDALFPFVDTLVSEVRGGASPIRLAEAADRVRRAADATASLVPRIGRARPLAERSVGTPDPGAISLGLITTALGQALARQERR